MSSALIVFSRPFILTLPHRYPSLLQSSDADGGSSVAVLTYLWRILEEVEHPDLINLILQYLLALTDSLSSEPITPRSPAVENKRQSLLSLSQVDGAEQALTPSFFNLTDLILGGVASQDAGTVTAALRLTTTLFVKHHPRAYSTILKVSTHVASETHRVYGALDYELSEYFELVNRIGGEAGVDEAYENCLRDTVGLVESHACSATRLGMTKGGAAIETRHRSAILEDQSQTVQPHHLIQDDPLISALMALLETFYTNDIETNLGLTNVLAHLAACPYTGLEGWLIVDPKNFELNLGNTQLTSADEAEIEAELDEDVSDDAGVEARTDPDKAEEARIGAFHASCQVPSWTKEATPRVLQVLQMLSQQLDNLRPTVPNLDHLLASRKRAFSGLDEMERQVQPPVSAARTPIDSVRPSRDASRARIAGPDSALSNVSGSEATPRGRSIAGVAGLPRQGASSTSPSKRNPRPVGPVRPQSPLSISQRNLSTSPQPNRMLSPLAATVMTPDDDEPQPLSARARSRMRAAEAEVLDRKLRFPTKLGQRKAELVNHESLTATSGNGDQPSDADRPPEAQGRTSDGDDSREASLSHVLTNIVILHEFVLELMALIQVRCSLLDGEVRFQ